MEHEVSIAYPAKHLEKLDPVFAHLNKKHSGEFMGSGCDIGGGEENIRDLQLVFKTKEAAEAFVEDAKKKVASLVFKVVYDVYPVEDEED